MSALPVVDSPPLAPQLIEQDRVMQQRFIWLHARRADYVVKWHWLLGGMQLRAYTGAGHMATISKAALDDLIERGLMKRGHGDQVELTAAGWAMGKQGVTV